MYEAMARHLQHCDRFGRHEDCFFGVTHPMIFVLDSQLLSTAQCETRQHLVCLTAPTLIATWEQQTMEIFNTTLAHLKTQQQSLSFLTVNLCV